MLTSDRRLGDALQAVLTPLGFSLHKPRPLAQAVQTLSEHFLSGQGSPWSKPAAQAAYLSYFLPRNELRARAVFHEAERLGFLQNVNELWDVGAGPATAWLAWQSLANPLRWLAIEPAIEAQRLGERLLKELHHPSPRWASQAPNGAPPDLVLFSYSLNEMNEPPAWAFDCPRWLVIEPSTSAQAQKVQQLRQRLIERGYFLWAPCTHQKSCPLLGGRDWCHTRIEVEMPEWFRAIESELPMRNPTLTFSYLLASREPPPRSLAHYARMVGEPLVEKGKTRQLICRGPEREFVAWLKRSGLKLELRRGDLVQLPEIVEKKASELRLTVAVRVIDHFEVFNSTTT